MSPHIAPPPVIVQVLHHHNHDRDHHHHFDHHFDHDCEQAAEPALAQAPPPLHGLPQVSPTLFYWWQLAPDFFSGGNLPLIFSGGNLPHTFLLVASCH